MLEVGVWRLGDKLERVNMSPIDSEARLEDMLVTDLSVLSPELMLVGRQIQTAHAKYIDVLAMNAEGNLVIIELKRDRTPRSVVAQTLDYASWISTLSLEDVADIYARNNAGSTLAEGYRHFFGGPLPDDVNESHEMIVVASELDAATERILNYLTDTYGVPMNAVFFQHFSDQGREYLTRSWLIDPKEAEANASRSGHRKGRASWNGRDFYVSFGEGQHRTWNDARRYGFISGGQGKWYSQTLHMLNPGARVFVHLPGTGFVGVGRVLEDAVPVRDFHVKIDEQRIPILECTLEAPKMSENSGDMELSEYLVRVEWIEAVPKEDAFWEPGLFASQHTACRLRHHGTIESLTNHFGVGDDEDVKGRKEFTAEEADEIRDCLRRKVTATPAEQKVIRRQLREMGFFISDYERNTGSFTWEEFNQLVTAGEISIVSCSNE